MFYHFESDDDRKNYKQYSLTNAQMKDYNVVIDGTNFFDHPIKNDLKTYDNIRKIVRWWLNNRIVTRLTLFWKIL